MKNGIEWGEEEEDWGYTGFWVSGGFVYLNVEGWRFHCLFSGLDWEGGGEGSEANGEI